MPVVGVVHPLRNEEPATVCLVGKPQVVRATGYRHGHQYRPPDVIGAQVAYRSGKGER